jgi:hypothetical protein
MSQITTRDESKWVYIYTGLVKSLHVKWQDELNNYRWNHMMNQITTQDESNNYMWNQRMSQVITREIPGGVK